MALTHSEREIETQRVNRVLPLLKDEWLRVLRAWYLDCLELHPPPIAREYVHLRGELIHAEIAKRERAKASILVGLRRATTSNVTMRDHLRELVRFPDWPDRPPFSLG